MPKPKMAKHINEQVRVFLRDGRELIGTLLAFDGHMNIVLDSVQEFRKAKSTSSNQRNLGLVVLRGDQIVSTIPDNNFNESPPQQNPISLQL